MNHLTEEAILIKKRIFEDFLKGSIHMLYHILMVGLSAALALSLPIVARFVAKQFLVYWSLVENDKVFLISIETISVIFFIFLSTFLRRSWKDRKLSNMARAAGMVWATPAKGFFAKRRVRKLKENQGIARDVMVISSTGFRTFVDPKGELHQVIQNCREAKIMLLNPYSEGAVVRAKSIPDPNVTPESFREQIRKSIDFLKILKAAQKNVKLRLYPDSPFLKMTILGDYIWLQHYQPGLDAQMMPKYVFRHDPNIGSLYFHFYQYFLGRWNTPDIPEYDLETDELIYRDLAGNEVRRDKFVKIKTEGNNHTNPKNHTIPKNDNEIEAGTPSSLRTHGGRASMCDFSIASYQHLQSGFHPGGKESFLRRPKNPICENAGWITIL